MPLVNIVIMEKTKIMFIMKIKCTNSNKEFKIINRDEKIDCSSLGDGGCIINNGSTFHM